MSDISRRCDVERSQDWRGWIEKMPYIKFDPTWEVKVIPPFAGALARFLVRYNGYVVSVYFDAYEQLGYMDGPYWEIHPVGGDVVRVLMNDVDGLLSAIAQSLMEQKAHQ